MTELMLGHLGPCLFGAARAAPPQKSVVFWGPHPTRLASLDFSRLRCDCSSASN
jgi:hypothetical protein